MFEKIDYITLSLITAFLLDLAIGDPVYMFHPVRLIGNYVIKPLEKILKMVRLHTRTGGLILLLITLTIPVGLVFMINCYLKTSLVLFYIFNIYIIYSCIAVKDLWTHIKKVIHALKENDTLQARKNLSMIVGRETDKLDNEGICRACIETLAENLSDGIIAPLFYTCIGGAPAAIFYKATNTMDSMVGYKNKKYKNLGYFPARFDDLINWIPSRLSMLIMVVIVNLFSKNYKAAIKTAINDRNKHSSPNAGHPEAAMAGILNIRLGGPGYYHGQLHNKPYINENGESACIKHIYKAWKIVIATSITGLIIFISCRLLFLKIFI